jgi:hypothetical protein
MNTPSRTLKLNVHTIAQTTQKSTNAKPESTHDNTRVRKCTSTNTKLKVNMIEVQGSQDVHIKPTLN